MTNGDFQCICHSEHARILADHDAKHEHNENEHEHFRCAIAQRIKQKSLYIILPTIGLFILGNIAFQWANYEKLKNVEKDVAVIQAQLSSHMKNFPKSPQITAKDKVNGPY